MLKERFEECPICGRRVRVHPVTEKFVAHSRKKSGRTKDCPGILNTERGAIIVGADIDRPLVSDRDWRTISGGLPTLGKG